MLVRTPDDLGAAIRDRRRRHGWSQQKLAEKIGVSRQWINEVEKGKIRSELGLVLRALEALDVTLWLDRNDWTDGEDDDDLDIDVILDGLDDALVVPDGLDDALVVPDGLDDALVVPDGLDDALVVPDGLDDALVVPDDLDDELVIPDLDDELDIDVIIDDIADGARGGDR